MCHFDDKNDELTHTFWYIVVSSTEVCVVILIFLRQNTDEEELGKEF